MNLLSLRTAGMISRFLIGLSFAGVIGIEQVRAAAPVNDAFASAAVLLPGSETVGTLDEATPDTSRPDILAGVLPSVWYRWSSNTDGQLNLQLINSPNSTTVESYEGILLATLTRVPRPGTTDISIDVKAGIEYWFAVSGQSGSFSLQSRFYPLAPADALGDRTLIAGEHVEILSGPRLATIETAEIQQATSGTLWWSWTAPKSGLLIARTKMISLFPPPSPYNIFAFTGNRFNQLAMAPQVFNPVYGQQVTAGTKYTLMVVLDRLSPNWAAAGDLEFLSVLDVVPIPPNDLFANRIQLTGSAAALTGDDRAAGLEDKEGSYGVATSLWWEWKAPTDGVVNFYDEAPLLQGRLLVFDQHPFETPGVLPQPVARAVVRSGQSLYICIGSAMGGGNQSAALRGPKSFHLELTAEIPKPEISIARFSQAAGLTLRVGGLFGIKAEVSYTSNLIDWIPWKSVNLQPDGLELLDEDAARDPHRFYRVTLP